MPKHAVPAKRRLPGPLSKKSAFELYLEEINRIPLLSREEEYQLARKYIDYGDKEAFRRLVEANLRFVVKMAYSYRHYDVKLIDLIQEGNIGLMRAVEKFKPERGYRLISYAVWWIKAYMQNYIIRSWSMVKLGTTQMQRQLFFRSRAEDHGLEYDAVEETLQEDISNGGEEAVFVPVESQRQKVRTELSRAMRDFSLDAVIDSEANLTLMDVLPSNDSHQEENLAKQEIMHAVAGRLNEIIRKLPEKERYVLEHRLLADEPETLQKIGEKFGVSRERVRQIETSVKKRIRSALKGIDGVAEIV